jgi:hypothetical protein
MKLSVEVSSHLTRELISAVDRLDGAGRVEGSEAMGHEVQTLIVFHLRTIAPSRHTTAQKLGASPSNFLAGAADAAAAGKVSADSEGVSISIRHPAVARAFRDIHIFPKRAKCLAIPIAAIAYNRRPAQLALEGHDMFVLGGKGQAVGRNVLAERMPDGSIHPLYLLVRSVTQPQDRTLMPSDENMHRAAARGLTNYVRVALAQGGLHSS